MTAKEKYDDLFGVLPVHLPEYIKSLIIQGMEAYAEYILSQAKHKHSAYDKDFVIDRNINNYLQKA